MKKVIAAYYYLFVAFSFSFFSIAPAAHGQTEAVSVEVPAIIQVQAGGDAALPLQIKPGGNMPEQAMLLIRGIPSSVSLDSGRHFASGVWAIKLSSASDLRIRANADIQEDAHLILSVVTLEGEYLSNSLARLVVMPPTDDPGNAEQNKTVIPTVAVETPDDAVGSTGAEAAEKNGVIELGGEDINKILKLMQKGDQYLLEGKIAAARRFYEYAAEMGWPDGAAAIARTFDPEHLKQFAILGGIEPDQKQADEWYKKSRELGKRIKFNDLARLGQN